MSCRVCVVLILYGYVCDGTIDGCNARISGSDHAGIDKKRRENGRLNASSMRIPGPHLMEILRSHKLKSRRRFILCPYPSQCPCS
ncbi:hypothetical protein EDB85DRAFT_394803 [Lactarius pseudohatsudake]|nr:hypothetical protein EDB85DRAFT_394803 [Lactarius pseudohatsudake]